MNAKFFALLLLCFIGLVGWQLYESHQRESALHAQVLLLERQVSLLEARLVATDAAVERLQQESLPTMVRKANSALLDAWQGLLNNLQEKVEESRRDLDDEPIDSSEGSENLKRI